MNNQLYSIIIPVYKTADSLIKISKRIKNVFHKTIKADYELIFVNDSPFIEETVNALNDIVKTDNNVIVIALTKNYGQQAATLSGIEVAKGEYIITMDDDLQHYPEDIPLLIDEQNHDIVIAKLTENKHSYFKQITSNLKGYFDYITLGKPKHIKLSSFRLINGKIAKMMLARKTPYPFIPALLFSISLDVINVEVKHNERFEGKSNYTLIKMLRLFSNLLINNSSFLLRTIGYIGITVSIISFLLGGYILTKKLFFDYTVEGWTSIMVSILFLGGMTLFTLGVIGEYLVRIIATAENRPVSFIRDIKKQDD